MIAKINENIKLKNSNAMAFNCYFENDTNSDLHSKIKSKTKGNKNT